MELDSSCSRESHISVSVCTDSHQQLKPHFLLFADNSMEASYNSSSSEQHLCHVDSLCFFHLLTYHLAHIIKEGSQCFNQWSFGCLSTCSRSGIKGVCLKASYSYTTTGLLTTAYQVWKLRKQDFQNCEHCRGAGWRSRGRPGTCVDASHPLNSKVWVAPICPLIQDPEAKAENMKEALYSPMLHRHWKQKVFAVVLSVFKSINNLFIPAAAVFCSVLSML